MKKKLYYLLPFVAVPTVMLLCEVLDERQILMMSPYKIGGLLLLLSVIIGFCSPTSRAFDWRMTVLMPLSLFMLMFLGGFLDQDDMGGRFHLYKAIRASVQPISLLLYGLMALVTCISSYRLFRKLK